MQTHKQAHALIEAHDKSGKRMGKRKGLEATEKQLEVFLFIVRFVERNGYQPPRQEIATAFGVDKRAILDRMKGLEERGYIDLAGGRDRAVRMPHIQFKAVILEKGPKEEE